jgi:hypothetical protein
MAMIKEPYRFRLRDNVSLRFQKLCAPASLTRISWSTSWPKPSLPGILAAYRLGASNAVAENINSQIQAAIVRARGFQSLRSLTNIILLTTGKLQNLPANPFTHAVSL